MPWWKRPFDLLIALPALLILAPVIAVLAVLVRVKLGAPVFFRQQRPGLHGKPFHMVKFRTMTDARDASGALVARRRPVDRFGRFLRSSQPGRAARTLECRQGRHESGRATPAADAIP
jgi:sugar transferase EpsL